jgi:hypothetical protein
VAFRHATPTPGCFENELAWLARPLQCDEEEHRSRPMQATPTHVKMARLYEAETAMRGRAARVGARLELPSSALWLLQLASHADAALDDLGALADGGEGTLPGGASAVRAWARGAAGWFGDLIPPDAAGVYRAIAADMRRDIDLACDLRSEAIARRDLRLAAWCALWIDQRSCLADSLTASLAEIERAQPASVWVETPVR